MSTSNVSIHDAVLNAMNPPKVEGEGLSSPNTPGTETGTVTKKDKHGNDVVDTENTPAEVTETETETKTKTSTDDKPLVKEPEKQDIFEIDASPEEIKSALTFFRDINNPEKAGQLIKSIVEQSGYDLTKKADVKATTRDAKAILKEKLGDAYEVLNGDALAEAVQEVVKSLVKEATEPLQENARLSEQQRNEAQANVAMDQFFDRNKITANKDKEATAGKMMELMAKMPPAKGSDVNEYLDNIFKIVNAENVGKQAVKTYVARTTKTAKEVDGKASGEGAAIQESRIKQGSKNATLDEAVRAAVKGERFDYTE